MSKHWEHTEFVDALTYKTFIDFNKPITSRASLDPNTAVYVQCVDTRNRIEGIYDDKKKAIRRLNHPADTKNKELKLYIDALNNPNITILAVDGLAGTAKTSTLIKWLVEEHMHNVKVPRNEAEAMNWKPAAGIHKVLIAKPQSTVDGEQYGFLPGDIADKLDPTLNNFIQYFNRFHVAGFNSLREGGYVDILPLGFIRGRDAENESIIVDEAQNSRELVSVANRRADKSRIFFLGDTSPFQIDRKGNTPKKNGLTGIIDLLAGAPYFQYIHMKALENILRSEEARDITRRLFKKHGIDPHDWKV